MSGEDLVAFLRVRLDEDERIARAAAAQFADETGLSWRSADGEYVAPSDPVDNSAVALGQFGFLGDAVADHIARHDPARALREVEAKRLILDQHAPVIDGTQSSWTWFQGSESASEQIVRVLAVPYADHPDYRAEWAPEAIRT